MKSFLLGLRLRELALETLSHVGAFFLGVVFVAGIVLRGFLRLLRWLVWAAVVIAFGAPVVAGACLAIIGLGLAFIAYQSGECIKAAVGRF